MLNIISVWKIPSDHDMKFSTVIVGRDNTQDINTRDVKRWCNKKSDFIISHVILIHHHSNVLELNQLGRKGLPL